MRDATEQMNTNFLYFLPVLKKSVSHKDNCWDCAHLCISAYFQTWPTLNCTDNTKIYITDMLHTVQVVLDDW